MEVLGSLLGLIPDAAGGIVKMARKECQIKLAPEIHPSIPYPMNGGNVQKFANIQVRFGSDTYLELIDAKFFFKKNEIRCEDRDIKLNGGKEWNSFDFDASSLTFVPDEVFIFKIRVSDHMGHCCELSSDMQMKQFLAPKQSGIKMGRWEIHQKGIFNAKCSRRKKF